MSKITTEKYDVVKIERLKNYLESNAEKNRAKFYEIFVDNLKAVDKTNDPACFDEYLMYMAEDTKIVKVLIYTSTENCPRNDKFIYTVADPVKESEEKRRQELSGIEVENKIQSALTSEREKLNAEILRKELDETKESLEEAETYIEQLQNELAESKNSKLKIKDHFGDIASQAIEGILRRNTHLLSGVPLLNGLAGVIEQDNKRLESEILGNTGVASFKRKTNDNNLSSKEPDPSVNRFAIFLQENFTGDELEKVAKINQILALNKENISIILNLLNQAVQETTGKDTSKAAA